jgi:hypothetical protein
MYGLNRDIDLSFLKGREVEQIAIGVYQIMFAFDEDVRISVEGRFSYFDGQREWVWEPEPGASQIAAQTVTLLGATIEKFEGHANGTLELVFSNGCRLTILDSSSQYESYNITRPGQTIIV